MSILSVSNLSLSRGGHMLLSGLNLELCAGRICVVLGPNGAGKSSLLLALSGLLQSEAGEVRLSGKGLQAYSRRELAGLIAWQGEMPPTEFGLSVEQRLSLAMCSGLQEGEGVERRKQACEAMGLSGLRRRVLGELSSGERQRVELAAMLVRDCPIWLLDEPCAHLDIRHQVDWLNIMRTQAGQGTSMLAVLHDVQQASAIADDVILIHGDGRVSCGAADELLRPEVLGELYGARLQLLGGEVMPDYRGGAALSGLGE